jgi:hypothetical protein
MNFLWSVKIFFRFFLSFFSSQKDANSYNIIELANYREMCVTTMARLFEIEQIIKKVLQQRIHLVKDIVLANKILNQGWRPNLNEDMVKQLKWALMTYEKRKELASRYDHLVTEFKRLQLLRIKLDVIISSVKLAQESLDLQKNGLRVDPEFVI